MGAANFDQAQRITDIICERMKLADVDIWKLDATTQMNGTHWVARVDFASHRGGGYQIFEGHFQPPSIQVMTTVLGRGRANPARAVEPLTSDDHLEAAAKEVQKQETLMDYDTAFDKERPD